MRKALAVFAAIVLMIGSVAIAASIAGSKNDPLITVSYLQNKFLPSLQKQMSDKAETSLGTAQSAVNTKFSAVTGSHKVPATDDEIAAALAAGMTANAGTLRSVSFTVGNTVTGKLGMCLSLENGSAKVVSGTLVNLTDGVEAKTGSVLKTNYAYLVPETGNTTIEITSSCTARVSGNYTITKVRVPVYTIYGDALKTLGLFQGTEKGYELSRPATRIEGLVMLIRLLGEEKEALGYTGVHRFTDVLPWADRYVAYAYHKGYTKGSTATTFGGSSQMTAPEYMTFLLRALEYSDAGGDFVWKEAVTKSVECGLITEKDKTEIESADKFYRDHIVFTSYQALFSNIKGSALQLQQKLLGSGAITQDKLNQAEKLVG